MMIRTTTNNEVIPSTPPTTGNRTNPPNEMMVSELFGKLFCCASTTTTTDDLPHPDAPLFDFKKKSRSILQSGANVDAILQMKSKHLAALTPTKRTSPPGTPVKPFCSKSYSQSKVITSSEHKSRRNQRDASRSPRSERSTRRTYSIAFTLDDVLSPISSNGTAATVSIRSDDESSFADSELGMLVTDDYDDSTLGSSLVAYPEIDHGENGKFDIDTTNAHDEDDDDDKRRNHLDDYEISFPPEIQLARVFSSPSLSHDIDYANDVVAEVDKERGDVSPRSPPSVIHTKPPSLLLKPPVLDVITTTPKQIEKRSLSSSSSSRTKSLNKEQRTPQYMFYNRSDFHCIRGRSDESPSYELKFDDISKRVMAYEQDIVIHRHYEQRNRSTTSFFGQ